MKPIFKVAVFLLYLCVGYFVIGKAFNYSIWAVLWAVPMGVFLGATWHSIDTMTVQATSVQEQV